MPTRRAISLQNQLVQATRNVRFRRSEWLVWSSSPVCTCSCSRMPPSGVAGVAPTERAAGRTTNGRVAHTRMARQTEMKLVRAANSASCPFAETPRRRPVSSETRHTLREIGAQSRRQTLITEVGASPRAHRTRHGTGGRHAKACNDTANHSSQRAARRMRHIGLRLQP